MFSFIILFLFFFKIFCPDLNRFLNLLFWNVTSLFNKSVSGNYQSFCSGSFIPKSKKQVLQTLIQGSEFPDIIGQFFEKFGVIFYLCLTNIVNYFFVMLGTLNFSKTKALLLKIQFQNVYSFQLLNGTKILKFH